MLRAAHARHHLAPRRLLIERHDVHPRHHDRVHLGVAQLEDAVEHRLLLGGHIRFRGDDLAEARRRVLALGLARRRHRERAPQPAVHGEAEPDERTRADLHGPDERTHRARQRRAGRAAQRARQRLGEGDHREHDDAGREQRGTRRRAPEPQRHGEPRSGEQLKGQEPDR